MWKPSLSLVVLALAVAPAFWAQSNTPALPAGPMQAKATTACLECHDACIIEQQRLNKATWTKEVAKIVML
jgi:cytochrome c553